MGFSALCSSRSKCFVVTGLSVEGLDSPEIVEIPKAISQPEIANTRSEVATPSMVRQMAHSAKYADQFHPLHPSAEVMLLIGIETVAQLWPPSVSLSLLIVKVEKHIFHISEISSDFPHFIKGANAIGNYKNFQPYR